MEESPLDMLAFYSAELSESLASVSNEVEKDALILNHIKKMHSTSTPIEDFKKNLEWFNLSSPLSLTRHCSDALVVLDFFTYCCINCFHVLPDLKHLEQVYTAKDGVVVIGVHSAKFDNEKDSEHVLAAVKRYGIRHPVVNDPDSVTWKKLGIMCWPTLLILGPQNTPLMVFTGEGHRAELMSFMAVAVKHFRGSIAPLTLPVFPNKHVPARSTDRLCFPGKVSLNPYFNAESSEPYLAISDSGNHRVLVTDSSGRVLHCVGGGQEGFKDGNFEEALLSSPQGVCWLGSRVLIVCDTGNHTLRTVHLDDGRVELLAGTGEQAKHGDHGGKLMGLQALSSPWDVVLHTTPDLDLSPGGTARRVLLVAMAGAHQIWALFLDTTIWWRYKTYTEGTCVAVVGSGREEARDSPYPAAAALAQPSGLAVRRSPPATCLVADAESSAVRSVKLAAAGQMTRVCGGARDPTNLFAFGDKDGVGYDAKLQHPLGIAYCELSKTCYVADTYNHKIKRVDLATNEIRTMNLTSSDTGEPIVFKEPSGLSVTPDGKYLYVADTNGHAVRVVNIPKMTCDAFDVKYQPRRQPARGVVNSNVVECERRLEIGENGILNLRFDVSLPKDVSYTKDAPQRWSVKIRKEGAAEWSVVEKGAGLPGSVNVELEGGYLLEIDFRLNICNKNVCSMEKFVSQFRTVSGNGPSMYNVTCKLSIDRTVLINLDD